MAKRISVKTAMSLNPTQFRNLTDRQLREAVQAMADAANKRVRRLAEADFLFTHPAVRQYEQALKKNPDAVPFQVPKSSRKPTQEESRQYRKKMRAMYERLRDFLNPDTTKSGNTVRGWRKVEAKFIEEMGGDEAAKKAIKSKRFWKLYRELEERYNGRQVKGSRKRAYDSDQLIQNLIRDKYQKKMSHSEIREENQQWLDTMEKQVMKERRSGTKQGSKSKKFHDLDE